MDHLMQELTERVTVGDNWPEPELLESILGTGDAAIEPLRALLRLCAGKQERENGCEIAVRLLGELKATAAVPDLLGLVRTGGDFEGEDALEALADIEDVPFDAVRFLADDPELDWGRRALGLELWERLSRKRPELRASLVEWHLGFLRQTIAASVPPAEDTDHLAGFAAATLAELGIEEARPLIAEAFARKAIHRDFSSPKDIEKLYRDFAEEQDREAEPEDSEASTGFLAQYREHYEAYHACDDDCGDPGHEADHPRYAHGPDCEHVHSDDTVPTEPIRVQKVGRNEPCPCGSGKKFKKCCIDKDALADAGLTAAERRSATPGDRDEAVSPEELPATWKG